MKKANSRMYILRCIKSMNIIAMVFFNSHIISLSRCELQVWGVALQVVSWSYEILKQSKSKLWKISVLVPLSTAKQEGKITETKLVCQVNSCPC